MDNTPSDLVAAINSALPRVFGAGQYLLAAAEELAPQFPEAAETAHRLVEELEDLLEQLANTRSAVGGSSCESQS